MLTHLGVAILPRKLSGACDMMDHFVVRYIPGGMSLYHSGYWLCRLWDLSNGTVHEAPIRMLQKADYK
jgi:hypothetical protein